MGSHFNFQLLSIPQLTISNYKTWSNIITKVSDLIKPRLSVYKSQYHRFVGTENNVSSHNATHVCDLDKRSHYTVSPLHAKIKCSN